MRAIFLAGNTFVYFYRILMDFNHFFFVCFYYFYGIYQILPRALYLKIYPTHNPFESSIILYFYKSSIFFWFVLEFFTKKIIICNLKKIRKFLNQKRLDFFSVRWGSRWALGFGYFQKSLYTIVKSLCQPQIRGFRGSSKILETLGFFPPSIWPSENPLSFSICLRKP